MTLNLLTPHLVSVISAAAAVLKVILAQSKTPACTTTLCPSYRKRVQRASHSSKRTNNNPNPNGILVYIIRYFRLTHRHQIPFSRFLSLCVVFSYRPDYSFQFLLLITQQIKDELCEVVAEMEKLDLHEDCKHSNKDKQMSIGRKKFNMDPKKGMQIVIHPMVYSMTHTASVLHNIMPIDAHVLCNQVINCTCSPAIWLKFNLNRCELYFLQRRQHNLRLINYLRGFYVKHRTKFESSKAKRMWVRRMA